jgi:hypothetical protein
MKFIYILPIVGLFQLQSCIDRTNNNSMNENGNDSLKKNLIGKWGGLHESMPVWNIKMDSIYYYDRAKNYSYKIINNDLIINIPGSKGVLKNIFVIKDTIFFLDEQGNQVRGYRFKGNN